MTEPTAAAERAAQTERLVAAALAVAWTRRALSNTPANDTMRALRERQEG